MTLVSIVIAVSAMSQSGDAVIYTEFGEPFTVYLNNQKKNSTPANNVQIKDLTSEFYSIRIDFEDASMQDVSNNHFAIQFGQSSSYMLKMTRKGKYALRFHSATPQGSAPDVVTTAPASRPASGNVTQRPGSDDPGSAMGVQTEVKVTESSHTTEEKVNTDIKMSAFGINMDVKVEESYSHTESDHSDRVEMDMDNKLTRPAEGRDEVYYDGPCSNPMTKSEFNGNLESIRGKSFEDSKLTMAKQMTKSKCLTSNQVGRVMAVFSFEDTKLEFAKFAFDYCVDTDNYFQVNNAFDFEMTIDELNEYLESK